jgi:hypothetical protein
MTSPSASSAHRTLSRSAAFSAALAISLVATGALAQDPAPAQLPPPAAPVASAPLTPASGAREDALTVGVYTCVVGEHAGVDVDDAHTAADVICHALASHEAHPGVYDIRLGKLGGKQLLVVTERATGSERRVFIQGVEEVPVASERVVAALVEGKSLAQTETVDTVVSSESTTPKQKKVQPGVILGLTGQSAVGAPDTMSAGIEIDMQFRLHNLALLGQGRAGGIGSGNNTLGYGSLGLGARYFLSDADFAPFIGGGLMFAYFQMNQNQGEGSNASGSGFGAYGELGLAFMRSSHVGGIINLRADVPVFSLQQSTSDEYNYSTGTYMTQASQSFYVVPISMNVGLSFQ